MERGFGFMLIQYFVMNSSRSLNFHSIMSFHCLWETLFKNWLSMLMNICTCLVCARSVMAVESSNIRSFSTYT
jgi:hypothetical protein